MGDVFGNEASPLQLRRLRDAVQEYVSQRRAMPEVREGVGEGAESAESAAAEIPAVDGDAAGRLIANRAAAFAVENSGIARRQR